MAGTLEGGFFRSPREPWVSVQGKSARARKYQTSMVETLALPILDSFLHCWKKRRMTLRRTAACASRLMLFINLRSSTTTTGPVVVVLNIGWFVVRINVLFWKVLECIAFLQTFILHCDRPAHINALTRLSHQQLVERWGTKLWDDAWVAGVVQSIGFLALGFSSTLSTISWRQVRPVADIVHGWLWWIKWIVIWHYRLLMSFAAPCLHFLRYDFLYWLCMSTSMAKRGSEHLQKDADTQLVASRCDCWSTSGGFAIMLVPDHVDWYRASWLDLNCFLSAWMKRRTRKFNFYRRLSMFSTFDIIIQKNWPICTGVTSDLYGIVRVSFLSWDGRRTCFDRSLISSTLQEDL